MREIIVLGKTASLLLSNTDIDDCFIDAFAKLVRKGWLEFSSESIGENKFTLTTSATQKTIINNV